MDDKQAVPAGTIGKVVMVDDAGTVHMNWRNGSTLGLMPDVDKFEIIRQLLLTMRIMRVKILLR